MQLAFKSYGQAGVPLLILHGLFGSSENWQTMSQRFAAHFRVFALDLRNHGDSPHAQGMSYSAMAADVHEFIVTQSLQPACVLGHSMGGKVAMQLALDQPGDVRALVVVDISPRVYLPHHKHILDAMLGLHLDAFQTRKQVEDALESEIPDLSTRRFLIKNLRRNAAGSFQWRLGLPEIAQDYPQLRRASEAVQPYGGPSLFVRGEKSSYLTAADLPEIRRLFTHAELVSVDGADHLVHAENPDGFYQRVVGFLRSETVLSWDSF